MPFGIGALFTAAGALASRLLFSRLGAWVAAGAVFLGLELVAYQVAIEPLRASAESAMTGIPAQVQEWMGVLRLDQYVTIVLSAYAASIVKKTLLRRRTAP